MASPLDDAAITAWTTGCTSEVRAIALATRALLHEVLPGLGETTGRGDNGVGFGAHQYGADGWGLGAIAVNRRWVSLGLMHGAQLADPDGLLEGTGKSVRHVKIRSLDELAQRREAIAALVRAAADYVG